MTDGKLPRLELPSAALHAPNSREPHVDSEEAVRFERERVARELDRLHSHASTQRSRASQERPSFATSRSRNASLPSSTASSSQLQRPPSCADRAFTDIDAVRQEQDDRGLQASAREPKWFHPIKKFWDMHVNITIAQGAHRDHLGMI
jgi:hypothetical protein